MSTLIWKQAHFRTSSSCSTSTPSQIILTLPPKKVDPRQQIFARKRQDDKGYLSIDIFPETARSLPLKTQYNGKGQIQKENNEDDGINKTRWISNAKSVEEVPNHDGPAEKMWDESHPVQIPADGVVRGQPVLLIFKLERQSKEHGASSEPKL